MEFETHLVIEDITYKDSSSVIPVAEIKAPGSEAAAARLNEISIMKRRKLKF